ncbi:MAG TPA: DUF559 domain-containing protein [Solirubrobacteraceae bacterium]|nr:DUF559 domain-containing protein [Solirubrobacteraceae bacterium]
MARLAGDQHGVVHVSQLAALGIGRSAMRHRIAKGRLHVVLPSVLSVGSSVLQPYGGQTAALLYAGDDVVISHDSAADLWGTPGNPSFVALTVVGRKVAEQPGVRIHRVATLDIRDVRLQHGLPVTAPARTLIDCATRPDIDELLNEARAQNLVTDTAIRQAIARCPGRTGIKALRALLEAEQESGYTQSQAERRLKRMVAAARLEKPIFNTYLEGIRVDAYWPRLNVVVEVDGYRFHGNWAAFQRDRARDNTLVGAGYVVLRFTWHQLTEEPWWVIAEIARTLGRREATAA